MSSAPDLMYAAETMASLGLISKDKADKVEHCVDDAVDLLSTLTGLINEYPELRQAVIEAKKKDVDYMLTNEHRFEYLGKDSSMLSDQILPNIPVFMLEEIEEELINPIVVVSDTLGIKNEVVGYKTRDGIYYKDISAVCYLNHRFDKKAV